MTSPIVGVHLDLKYVMPCRTYLHRWVRELAQSGINTLLLEYEDKFPFEKYPFLRDRDAFTPEQLHEFLSVARGAGLRIIPLVQTLSHLEFALAHDELATLREREDIPTQINISNPEAQSFVRDLIDEVLEYHQDDEFFHLGADEAWFLGASENYRDDVEKIGLVGVWARHIVPLCERVIAQGKRPLVWDDIFWPDPNLVASHGLPGQVIFASWNYSVVPDDGDDALARVDVYRKAGFDVIGVPCLNWGVLYPMHDHCLSNTRAWAEQARKTDLLGIVNSAWSCFHTPLPTHLLYAAATARLLTGPSADFPPNWEEEYLTGYYGTEVAGMVPALRALGTNWEVSVPILGRPITPIVYGYMDMVLGYAGGQEERRKCGGYPLNWGEIDFDSMLRKKIELMRANTDQGAIKLKLLELGSVYASANETLKMLAERSTLHQEEAQLLAAFARLKWLYVGFWQHVLFDIGNAASIRTEVASLGVQLAASLEPFLEAASVERMLTIWWRPAAIAMEEGDDG